MRGAAALAVAFAGCVAVPSDAPEPSGLALRPVAGGLAVDGSGGLEIGFGRAQSGVLASAAKVEGRVPDAEECGDGRVAFRTARGVLLAFEDRRFVGWSDGGAYAGRPCLTG